MREFKDRKGLKFFSLFKQTWKVGRFNEKDSHVVIYGPDDKEYHVYGNDAKGLREYCESREEWFISKTKAKYYILTSILDERKNWCFDMNAKPNIGDKVKVLCEGATIRFISSFTGDWEAHKLVLPTKHPIGLNPEWQNSLGKTIRDKKGNIKPSPSQFIWKDAEEYKNIIAWRIK
jgi:hypothetical protein